MLMLSHSKYTQETWDERLGTICVWPIRAKDSAATLLMNLGEFRLSRSVYQTRNADVLFNYSGLHAFKQMDDALLYFKLGGGGAEDGSLGALSDMKVYADLATYDEDRFLTNDIPRMYAVLID